MKLTERKIREVVNFYPGKIEFLPKYTTTKKKNQMLDSLLLSYSTLYDMFAEEKATEKNMVAFNYAINNLLTKNAWFELEKPTGSKFEKSLKEAIKEMREACVTYWQAWQSLSNFDDLKKE